MRTELSVKISMVVGISYLLATLAGAARADLVAYWPFDEGVGTVAGDVVGGNDGTLTGGTWVTPGKFGTAAIEGVGGDRADSSNEPTPTTEDLTLSWWMIDNNASYGRVMSKIGDDSTRGYSVLLRPESEDYPLIFRIGGENWPLYGGWGVECSLPKGSYNDGEWVHITCTYDSATDTAKIYVNGELPVGNNNPKTGIAGDGGYCDGVNNPDVPLNIFGGKEPFNGVLDEVAIWNSALTQEQIKQVYAFGPDAFDFQPAPAHESVVLTNVVTQLEWTNMPPNTQGDDVPVAVWFMQPGGTMSLVLDPNDQAAKNATSFGPIDTSLEGTYTWRIDSYLNGAANINEPNRVEGNLYTFTVIADPGPEITSITANQMTWSGKEVPLAVTATNEGPSETIYHWTYATDPAADVSIIDGDTATPKVTITKLVDPPAIQTVTLTVEVSDAVNPTPKSATMEIDVYDNACEMAKIGEGKVVPTDFNGDCVTNLEDFAQLAAVWLQDYSSTGPMAQ
ncbi:MAG: LamG domain-containing protein [Phycisphaerae bacterium]|nr:LamG domain-containing protein [Phycisphaerae bacterium]